MTIEERAAHLALALVPGIGAHRFAALVRAFGTPAAVLRASRRHLLTVRGIGPAAAAAIAAGDRDAAARVLDQVAAHGGMVLLPHDAGYPALLRMIPDPPLALFAYGNADWLEPPAVAVVGARDHTAYGAEVARTLAEGAARAGLVVVSGMARGLDAVAHTGALDAGGGTIGVLGNGHGVIYPAANRALYERVETAGLLLTEHPPGERPHAGTFPRRNRVIAGLARVTVVVEAAPGSGALITADAALEQGRDVVAVPGPITSPVSTGTNRLIRDGATPYLDLDDLLAAYPVLEARSAARAAPTRGPQPEVEAPPPPQPSPDLPPDVAAVWQALAVEPVLPDQLAERLALPIPRLLTHLATLELAGLALHRPGGRFSRTPFAP